MRKKEKNGSSTSNLDTVNPASQRNWVVGVVGAKSLLSIKIPLAGVFKVTAIGKSSQQYVASGDIKVSIFKTIDFNIHL